MLILKCSGYQSGGSNNRDVMILRFNSMCVKMVQVEGRREGQKEWGVAVAGDNL